MHKRYINKNDWFEYNKWHVCFVDCNQLEILPANIECHGVESKVLAAAVFYLKWKKKCAKFLETFFFGSKLFCSDVVTWCDIKTRKLTSITICLSHAHVKSVHIDSTSTVIMKLCMCMSFTYS